MKYLNAIIIFIWLTTPNIFASSKIDEIKMIRDFLQMLCTKDVITNEDACHYFGEGLWEYETTLTYKLYGKHVSKPCSKEHLHKKSETLKALKDWLIMNNYNFCAEVSFNKNYFREKTNEYTKKSDGKEYPIEGKIIATIVTAKINDKKLNFSIPMLNPPYITQRKISFYITNEKNEKILDKMLSCIAEPSYTINVSTPKGAKNNLSDNNFSTVWIAGGKNRGINEFIEYEFDKEYYIVDLLVVNGMAKDKKSFWEYNRVKKIKIEYNQEEKIIQLKDSHYLEKYPIDNRTKKIKVTILDIYQGKKYQTKTCLTELKFSFTEGDSFKRPKTLP